MSLPILVTPAAKLLQTKPSAPVATSDKPSFARAIDSAERRGEVAKPASQDSEVSQEPKAPAKAPSEPSDKPAEQEPQAPQAEVSEKPEPLPAPQSPVDVQMLVAVASQLVMPAAQPVAQQPVQMPLQPIIGPTAQPVVEALAPVLEAAAPAPVQQAPAAPVVQQAVAEQVKPTDIKPPEVAQPQASAPAVPTETQAAIAPTAQPETGAQQEPSKDSGDPSRKASKPPVMPVAAQQVRQSMESVRASEQVAPVVAAHEPATMDAKAPVLVSAKPAQDAAASALVTEAAKQIEDVQPATETVKPWQLPHAVGGEQAPQAQVLEDGAPAGEAMPMREAMRMPFTQAAKEPGKPSELRLQLSPEHLGRMEIRVMSHEGSLSAQIRVDHAQAREMMQTQIAELRQTLADQGIKIDRLEVSVGQDKPRGEQSFAFGGNLQQQAGQQQQQAQQASAGRVSYYGTETFEEVAEEVEGLPLAGVAATAVDYQA